MNKRLILILSTVTIITGGSYFLAGKIIQKSYYSHIANLSKNSNLKVSLIKYNRGIFHSESKIALEVPDGDTSNPQLFFISQKISHGPIIINNTPKGFPIKIAAGAIKTSFADYNPNSVEINTIISFNKQAVTWVKIHASENPEFSWDEIIGQIAHDLNFINYRGQISAPQIALTNGDTVLKIKNLTANLNASSNAGNYYNSNSINSREVIIDKHGIESLSLDNFSIKVDLATNPEKLINFDLLATIGESQIEDQKFAGDKLSLKINNINPSALPSISPTSYLSIKTGIDFIQQISSPANTQLVLEVPKKFTETFISYISYELYESSILGKLDKRPKDQVRTDINKSVNKIIANALKQKLFIENQDSYTLSFG